MESCPLLESRSRHRSGSIPRYHGPLRDYSCRRTGRRYGMSRRVLYREPAVCAAVDTNVFHNRFIGPQAFTIACRWDFLSNRLLQPTSRNIRRKNQPIINIPRNGLLQADIADLGFNCWQPTRIVFSVLSKPDFANHRANDWQNSGVSVYPPLLPVAL